ncbi:hypothetical protein B0J14DRAFT_639956 [Halenospora varia]|nr:hypothetical protein B0J14DRAFT_639956 [Halenospora varia]
MSGPLSIVAGVVGLLAVATKAAIALKDFHDGAAIADTKVMELMADVESFMKALQLMKDTLEQEEAQASIQGTGHIGNHWKNLSQCIQDGQMTIEQLQSTLDKVNKTVSVLDGPRKHLRLKSALDEIGMYQQQIESYRDTLQLSIQTIILWNQITFNDKILPNLDELHQTIRRLAFDLNHRIINLQTLVESGLNTSSINALVNLKNCIQSAASVVSSASITMGIDETDQSAANYGSEFGDCFPVQQGETMSRWISSNTVYEFDEGAFPADRPPTPMDTSPLRLEGSRESEKSDSDSDLEDKPAKQDFETAERLFKNCLTRTSSSPSLTSTHCGTKFQVVRYLVDTYCQQEKWNEAAPLLMEKIAMGSSKDTNHRSNVLVDTLSLSEVLFKKGSYVEALLYGRRALKGYRRVGCELGTTNIEKTLELLIRICHSAGNPDEEDAYAAILSDFQEKAALDQQVVVTKRLSSPTEALTLPASAISTSQSNMSKESEWLKVEKGAGNNEKAQQDLPDFKTIGNEKQGRAVEPGHVSVASTVSENEDRYLIITPIVDSPSRHEEENSSVINPLLTRSRPPQSDGFSDTDNSANIARTKPSEASLAVSSRPPPLPEVIMADSQASSSTHTAELKSRSRAQPLSIYRSEALRPTSSDGHTSVPVVFHSRSKSTPPASEESSVTDYDPFNYTLNSVVKAKEGSCWPSSRKFETNMLPGQLQLVSQRSKPSLIDHPMTPQSNPDILVCLPDSSARNLNRVPEFTKDEPPEQELELETSRVVYGTPLWGKERMELRGQLIVGLNVKLLRRGWP